MLSFLSLGTMRTIFFVVFCFSALSNMAGNGAPPNSTSEKCAYQMPEKTCADKKVWKENTCYHIRIHIRVTENISPVVASKTPGHINLPVGSTIRPKGTSKGLYTFKSAIPPAFILHLSPYFFI
jgi:hypothetical protein